MNNIDNKDNVLNNMENDNTKLDKDLEKSLISENDSTNSNQNKLNKKNSERANDLLDDYFYDIEKCFKKVEQESKFADYYYDTVNSGDNKFYLKNITETKMFDEEWIKTMEVFFPSIDKIIRNPKMTIRYEEEVVVIEKAKKINSASVRHLASHTQLIREVKGDEVTPKKILNTYAEEEIATYENRFIMTLIDRVYNFIRKRHELIKDNVESFQKDHLRYSSNFEIANETVDMQIDLTIKRDLDNDKINKHNKVLLERVNNLMVLINGYRLSPFMQAMKKAKKVFPPIMKTNVILKNPDFRNAYTLWLFLDKYNSLGFDIDVRERPVRLSKEFKKNLDRLSSFTYSALLNNKKKRKEDFTDIEKVDPIIRKSTKIVKELDEDIIRRPDAFMVENNSINEYYLDIFKKTFNLKVKEYIQEKVKDDVALKRTIKDALDVTNALFDSVFTLEENIDYFKQYVTEEDPTAAYDEAKKKLKVAKAIREAKEQDFKKALKLEKSLYKTMIGANNARIKESYRQKRDAQLAEYGVQVEKELKKFEKEKERLNTQISKLEGTFKEFEFSKDFLTLEYEELKEEMKKATKEINSQCRSELNKELSLINKKHKNKMETLKKSLEEKLEKAKIKKAEREAKNKETLANHKAKEKEKAKNKNKEIIAKQIAKNNNEEEKLRKQYQAKIEALNKMIKKPKKDEE